MSDTTATSSCCSPTGSCHSQAATETAAAQPVTTVYEVSGMTCGHCEASVSREIGALDGVGTVQVELSTGRVTVTTDEEPDDTRIAAAVDAAGYTLTGRAAQEER
ncbi:heavy-metal-associated domain-containing protein [Streptomyces albus]|uniref:heavy-metal-associated domain-containing protein n=1 Tax=Streptomyces albus TaxID=1888 RepID=UPI003453607E